VSDTITYDAAAIRIVMSGSERSPPRIWTGPEMKQLSTLRHFCAKSCQREDSSGGRRRKSFLDDRQPYALKYVYCASGHVS
jgi:hypothetical protein